MSIQVQVDPTNPGQFFACCGLLELADRLWPGAEGWFEPRHFSVACGGAMGKLLDNLADCALANTMTEAQHARLQEISAMSGKLRKSTPGVEDEYKLLDKLRREPNIVLGDPFGITLDRGHPIPDPLKLAGQRQPGPAGVHNRGHPIPDPLKRFLTAVSYAASSP